MVSQAVKLITGAIFCGILVSFVTGLVENRPEVSIVEAKYYGFPKVWRLTMTLQPDQYEVENFVLDTIFWALISTVALLLVRRAKTHKVPAA